MNWQVASLVTLIALLALGTDGVEGRRGRDLVTTIDIPAEAIEAMLAATPDGAFTEGWMLPDTQPLASTGNPWRVELELDAAPDRDGDARALFLISWHGAPSDEDMGAPVQPLRFGLADARGGSRVTTHRVGLPLSLREDREVHFELALAEHHNLAIRGLRLHLWSGMPSPGWREVLGNLRLLWIGLIFGLFVYWRRRERQPALAE